MPATAPLEQPPRHDDLDNYNVADLSDDPFASPPSSPKHKRKQADAGLGIDEEVSVQKRQRPPAAKLDEDRLLSAAGLPELRKRARKLRFKGKGHEFSDAGRLLSFYQMWLDDLFPKARFLDALEMVEKAGHKKRLLAAREEWIDEGRPKTRTEDDNDNEATTQPQEQSTTQPRPTTPPAGDIPDEDDLYNTTPRAAPRPPAGGPTDDMPDDDELDALMAEYGGPGDAPPALNPQPRRQNPTGEDDDDDDLEFLMAESERQDKPAASESEVRKSLGASGTSGATGRAAEEEEMEGLWD
ncbi:hypothetical protein S40288_07938 [Stachybotrys chartarum IBT 40288]|nr:hypothetical protein S40288_07938 [Stachybotrys chartarum IBT 40288]